MVIIYSYVEKGNEKVLKFYTNSVCYSEMSSSLFLVPPPNNRCTSKLPN